MPTRYSGNCSPARVIRAPPDRRVRKVPQAMMAPPGLPAHPELKDRKATWGQQVRRVHKARLARRDRKARPVQLARAARRVHKVRKAKLARTAHKVLRVRRARR